MAKVLYIEDDIECVNLVGHILRIGGHRMLSARDAKSGLALAYREIPDLILMDLHLPRVNGAQAVDLLKSTQRMRDIPVIAVTASRSDTTTDLLRNNGCVAVIYKPFTPQNLLKSIQEMLPTAARA